MRIQIKILIYILILKFLHLLDLSTHVLRSVMAHKVF
jgi:hypothetical protein